MRPLNFAACTGVVLFTLVMEISTAGAQERLPAYVRTNAYAAGQVYGCTVRLERYLHQTLDRAAATGRTLPVTQLNTIAGLDVGALKADAAAALIGLGNGSYPTEEIELAVSEIADAEYDGTDFGAPGYSEAWFQAMGCAAVFRQFGLYDSYG